MIEFVILFIVVLLMAILISIKSDVVIGGVGSKKSTTQHKHKDLTLFPASRFENTVRAAFERICGAKFPCVYPTWLKYDGKQLELDGYSEKLKLAFECQGPQHTAFYRKNDPSYDKYIQRVQNDKMKIKLAKENGVGLIIIDYRVPKYLLGSYIKSRIYDVAQEWYEQGLYVEYGNLKHLNTKPGDYVEKIEPSALT